MSFQRIFQAKPEPAKPLQTKSLFAPRPAPFQESAEEETAFPPVHLGRDFSAIPFKAVHPAPALGPSSVSCPFMPQMQAKPEPAKPLQTKSLFAPRSALFQESAQEEAVFPPVHLGRDFSAIPFKAVHPAPALGLSSISCPFTPERCPFGGACHACPPKMQLQAKLKIGQPGDRYEQEADRVAEQVMRMPEPQVQRKAACASCVDKDEEDKLMQTKPLAEQITPVAQRKPGPEAEKKDEDDDELLQAKSASGIGNAQEVHHPLIQSVLASPGQPLDAATRSFMEPRFGQDFSGVRVHVGGQAAESARAVNARAYTVGQDMVFGEGQYAPGSDEGRRLVAHELVHVGQQATKDVSEEIVQRDHDAGKDIIPDPVEVIWGGDPLKIKFRRTDEDGGRFEFIVNYLGPHPVTGPFVENKTTYLSTMIGSAKLNARVLRQTNTLIEVDLYGDGSRVVKLTDSVAFDSRSISKGREHDFNVMVLGKSVYAASFWVLDSKAKASDIPTTQPEESPGENPSCRLLEGRTVEIRIDGDGDQYKELLLRIRPKSFLYSAVEFFGTKVDIVKSVLLQIEQISTNQVREATFDIDLKKDIIPTLWFSIVEQVTDGFVPTKISISEITSIEIYPPERTPQNVKYLVVAAGNRFSFGFPPERSEIHKVAAPGDASVIGNIVSTDIALGAYSDKFRFTVQPKTNDQAVLGISPLYKNEALGGVGVDLKIDGTVRFQVLLTGDVSLGVDLNGDKKPDLMIYDQLTTPQEVDGGGLPENNRNHRIRVVGEAIGGEKSFYFQVRHGTLMPSLGGSSADKAAMSNAQAVSGLKQQAAEGTFENQLDAYESALMAERKKASDAGLIRKATYDAWAALSLAMIKLQPQITKTVNASLQGEASKQAEVLCKSIADETKHKTKPIAATEASFTSANPYTGEMTTIATFYSSTTGAGPELSGDIKAGRWSKAFANYQRLVSGLDQWILDRLKAVKGEHSAEAQRVGLLAGRKRELGGIEKHNPKRILAVFHPSEKFKGEQGYVTEFPLALYYWKEGKAWHLKDITNPEKTYDYTVSAVDKEQEPPLRLLGELNDPDHFPVGVIHYDIPGKYAGEIQTKDYLTWKKFFTYLGLGLAAVGLTLSTFGTGSVVVAGTWVLAASALAGGTAAAIDLIERGQQGNLDATTAVIDIAQIVAAFSGVSAIAAGKIVMRATLAAKAGTPLTGTAARLAVFADRLYVPLVATRLTSDAVTVATFTLETAKQMDAIQNSPGDQPDKDRAKALLLSQLALSGGLLALSVKGELPQLMGRNPLVLEHLGRIHVALIGENTSIIHTTTAGTPKTEFVRVRFNLSTPEQIEYLTTNVSGLTAEQVEFLLQQVGKKGGAIIFGGSRVRGNVNVSPQGTVTSDLDVGFDKLTKGQINGIMNDFNKKFTGSSKTKIIEHNWIFPNSEPKDIPKIVTPEEFFMRSGVRGTTDGTKANQPFGPSGYISVEPNIGVIEAGRL